MPLIPLHGHTALRARLTAAARRDALPGSLLIQGSPRIGKQRLALWLGQWLLCPNRSEQPCGHCTSCRYAADLVHPDLRWFFPRPRVADGDARAEVVLEEYAAAAAERAAASGLYPSPSGTDALYVATVRAIGQLAGRTPAMSARKVIVVGDAERMVPQEGADAAANAFLKLLEEPPTDTVILLTSSEPGALLPTIRSRAVAIRAVPLSDAEMRGFIDDPAVASVLAPATDGSGTEARVRLAAGAPGRLLDASARDEAMATARALLDAARHSRADRMQLALALGGARARGFFSDVLDALNVLLRDRAAAATRSREFDRARRASLAVEEVERAKQRAAGNVSPQLIGAVLLRRLAEPAT